MATVAINGLGRIGRATLKVLTGLDGIRIAAINDPAGLHAPIRDAHIHELLYCLLSRRRRGHVAGVDGQFLQT